MRYEAFTYPLIFFVITNIVIYYISFSFGYVMSLCLLAFVFLLFIKGVVNLLTPMRKRLVFHKGFHRTIGLKISPFMYLGKTKEFILKERYIFDKKSYFNYGNEIDHQENKLFGISYRLLPGIRKEEIILGHHYSSVRIAWRWLTTDKGIYLALSSYVYEKEIVSINQICMLELKDSIDFTASIEVMNGVTTLRIKAKTDIKFVFDEYHLDFTGGPQLKTFGYYLSEYIGGIYPAKQRIEIIKIKS